VWLTNDEFSLGVVDEAQTLRKRMQLDELVLVETTLLTNQPPVRFGAAIEKGRGLVTEGTDRRFELAIDVRRARHRQIKPLALDAQDASPSLAVAATVGTAATLELPPGFVEEEVVPEAADETLDRLERWKRKLLDLSLRNKLLNFKSEKSAVTLVCPDPGHFEDKLAAGEPIKLLPRADVMSGADSRSADLHFRKAGEDAAKKYALEAMRRGDVHTTLSPDDLIAGIGRTNWSPVWQNDLVAAAQKAANLMGRYIWLRALSANSEKSSPPYQNGQSSEATPAIWSMAAETNISAETSFDKLRNTMGRANGLSAGSGSAPRMSRRVGASTPAKSCIEWE
jgi:Protein of unknown function (DUF4011)